MTYLQAIVLGIVQGITEFLPISSSGHLVLVPYLLGWNLTPEFIFPFDVIVQLGTLAAVIIYFWKDLMEIAAQFVRGILQKKPFEDPHSRSGWLILLATLPAAAAGLLLNNLVAAAFHSEVATALFLYGTAILLFASEKFSKIDRNLQEIGWKDALWIGLAQALAIFPGISRSGATIAGGMSRGINRKDSARFSFLMSIPIMVGAGLKSLLELTQMSDYARLLPLLAVGFLTAAVVGYVCIAWLLKFITKHSFNIFAAYCAGIATLILLLNYAF